jgi:Zn-dependent protease
VAANVSHDRAPRALTIARVQAIEIVLHWRWVPILVLCTWLLARNVLPARYPAWEWGTTWLTSIAVVLAGEIALLLHELSHALMARGRGRELTRIVFHGFQAETIVAERLRAPGHDALVALVGPGTNLALAGLVQVTRLAFAPDGPLDVALVLLILGNLAAATMSLLPIGASDGHRALSAVRRFRTADSP